MPISPLNIPLTFACFNLLFFIENELPIGEHQYECAMRNKRLLHSHVAQRDGKLHVKRSPNETMQMKSKTDKNPKNIRRIENHFKVPKTVLICSVLLIVCVYRFHSIVDPFICCHRSRISALKKCRLSTTDRSQFNSIATRWMLSQKN